MFIFGSDDDDKRVFSRTAEFCNEHHVDSAQYAILTPMPGTVVYKDFERQNRLLHKAWEYYDGLHAVFKPKHMTPLELQQGMIDAFKDFYSYTRAINDALNIVVEYNTNALRSLYTRVNPRSFTTVGIKMMGAKVLKSWVKNNSDYLQFLHRLDLGKRTLQRFSTPQTTP
jgi:radical SAM superfamily enzyme YgiQ (UPF0313 family)